MADEPTTPDATAKADPPKATTATPKQPEPAKGDEPLGEAGRKALEAEREARKQAEAQVAALRKDFEGFQTKLSEAFGIQPATGGDGTDVVKQLQQRLDTMQHETAVYRLAAQHEITDEGDLELLKSATDEAAMTRLAERLAAKAQTPGTPKPDATQGGAGGTPPALNSNALEQALKAKLGIS
jgi:uncharacterized protein (UPF0261 family)